MWRTVRVAGTANYDMKVLYGCLADQDEVGGGASRSAIQPIRLLLELPRFLFDRSGRQALNGGVGHGRRKALVTLRDGFIEF